MKKQFFALLCITFLFSANAICQENDGQDKINFPLVVNTKGEEVRYALLDNTQGDSNKFYGNLNIEVDAGLANISFNLNTDVKYKLPNLLFFGEYSHGYPDVAITEISKNVKRTPYQNSEVGGVYFFKAEQRGNNAPPVAISEPETHYYSNYTGRRFVAYGKAKTVKVPAKYSVQWGARAGYQFLGQRVGGIRNSADLGDKLHLTAIESNSIFLGISKVSTCNIRINTKKYGVCTRNGFQHYYADVLYAATYKGTFYRPAGAKYEPANIEDTYKKLPVGFRMGFEDIQYNGKISKSIGLEFGMRPGYTQVYNLYFMAKLGHGISM